jgi:hypothetical protein
MEIKKTQQQSSTQQYTESQKLIPIENRDENTLNNAVFFTMFMVSTWLEKTNLKSEYRTFTKNKPQICSSDTPPFPYYVPVFIEFLF